VLHVSNAAPAKAPQAHLLAGAGTIDLPVPAATYSKIYLLVTSSKGDSTLNATLFYADGSTSLTIFTLPDWGTGKPLPTSPPIFFNLISGLHKWNAQNQSIDTPSHGITGVVLTPTAGKTLRQIQLAKTGAMQSLTLWGVTGVATSAVGPATPVPDGGGPGDGAAPPDAVAVPDASDAQTAGAGGNGAAGATGAGAAAGGPASSGAAGQVDAGGSAAPTGASGSLGSAGVTGTAGTPAHAKASSGCSLGGGDPASPWPVAFALALRALTRRRRRRPLRFRGRGEERPAPTSRRLGG
jgi:MYXO-CTERM domain-containing protein